MEQSPVLNPTQGDLCLQTGQLCNDDHCLLGSQYSLFSDVTRKWSFSALQIRLQHSSKIEPPNLSPISHQHLYWVTSSVSVLHHRTGFVISAKPVWASFCLCPALERQSVLGMNQPRMRYCGRQDSKDAPTPQQDSHFLNIQSFI